MKKNIIEFITPDVLVKGADYEISNIVGADWVLKHGGQVKTIEFLPGYSTTAIEKKIIAANKLWSLFCKYYKQYQIFIFYFYG